MQNEGISACAAPTARYFNFVGGVIAQVSGVIAFFELCLFVERMWN